MRGFRMDLLWWAAAATGVAVGPAAADVALLSSPADFTGGETFVSFELALTPLVDRVPTAGNVDFQLATGDPPLFLVDVVLREYDPPPDYEGCIVNRIGQPPDDQYPDLTLTFPGLVNRVSFELRARPGYDLDLTLTDSGSGDVVEAFTLASRATEDPQWRFYGFESRNTPGFDTLVLHVEDNDPGFLDSLRYEMDAAIVPAPGSGLLTAMGLGLLGCRRRRRASRPPC